MSMGKCSKIRHIVQLRQMLRRWRNKARMSSASGRVPADVPAGHVAVCVGPSYRRVIIRATHLNHPVIKKLLVEAEEEHGVSSFPGPLCIPTCDECLFEEAIRFVSSGHHPARFERTNNNCHVGPAGLWVESRPLLHGLANSMSTPW